MIHHAAPQAPPTIRPCGFTRRELRNLRATSGLKRPFKVRTWLLDKTALAQYGTPLDKHFARVFEPTVARLKQRSRRRG